MTRREYIQVFIDRVLNWDQEDILEFAKLLYDVDHHVRLDWDASMDRWTDTFEHLSDYLDLAKLPTCPIPKDLKDTHLVYAMDRQGNCLIRMDFDSTHYGHFFNHMIRHIDQLRNA
jgi:hypothetical protein